MYNVKPGTWREAGTLTGKIIDLYNHQRPHQSIGYMVPAQVHQTGMKTERMWKNYYRNRHVPPDGNTEEDKDNVPESDGVKNGCPEKTERETFHQGKGAEAQPKRNFPDEKRKVGREQTVNKM
jgi:hypothetical protein